MEQEGVIKYRLAFTHRNLHIDEASLDDINTSRQKMLNHKLIGQDDLRYDGYGFGNISRRCLKKNNAFWISGTQTGHQNTLSGSDVSLVTIVYPEVNTILAQGRSQPSSESMTHGVLYQLDSHINAVIHVHSPDIWDNRKRLDLPGTPADIPYGTPEMAESVERLAKRLIRSDQPLVFCMNGHEDGVIAAGASLAQCSEALIDTLQAAKRYA